MLNLSTEVARYINSEFQGTQMEQVLEGFSLLESYSLPNYEDKYSELLYYEEETDVAYRGDMFIELLRKDLTSIIEIHGVKLSIDYPANLNELVKIASSFKMISSLEDYSFVKYRVMSNDESTDVFITLLEHYYMLPVVRCMELIEDVSDELIEAIRELCEDEVEEEEAYCGNHLRHVNLFFEFINGADCLGSRFREKGYGLNLTLEELLNIDPINLEDHIGSLLMVNKPQLALDILSLLIITKDGYKEPMVKFQANSELFIMDLASITIIKSAMSSMVSDFNSFLSAKEQEVKING